MSPVRPSTFLILWVRPLPCLASARRDTGVDLLRLRLAHFLESPRYWPPLHFPLARFVPAFLLPIRCAFVPPVRRHLPTRNALLPGPDMVSSGMHGLLRS